MAQKFQNLINGKWVDAQSGRTFENRNPANWEEVVGIFPKSGKEDVNEAVKAARAAFEKWRLVPAPKRGDIMRAIGDLLVKRKEEISREMTREMGKVLAETRGDVQVARRRELLRDGLVFRTLMEGALQMHDGLVVLIDRVVVASFFKLFVSVCLVHAPEI